MNLVLDQGNFEFCTKSGKSQGIIFTLMCGNPADYLGVLRCPLHHFKGVPRWEISFGNPYSLLNLYTNCFIRILLCEIKFQDLFLELKLKNIYGIILGLSFIGRTLHSQMIFKVSV